MEYLKLWTYSSILHRNCMLQNIILAFCLYSLNFLSTYAVILKIIIRLEMTAASINYQQTFSDNVLLHRLSYT